MFQGPTAFTSPGCQSGAHRDALMSATLRWSGGERWLLPVRMGCGCDLWLGEEAERLAEAEGWRA